MDRNANAAAALNDARFAPLGGEPSQLRSIPDLPFAKGGTTPAEKRAKPLTPGTCVAGKYIICDVLGTGGAAVVYAAEQVGLKRVVAFKLYPVGGEVASQLLERFEREAQLLARVHHENVVAVFDAGCMADGSPYLIVQRLRGDSLATRLEAGPLPLDEAIDLARQVASALVALSDAGITHRDVKPGNLVLDRDQDGCTVLKLVDFGIAKHTHDVWSRALDEMVGTPHYMAPEQVLGEKIEPRADLYALGATLYEMLTGCTPHGEAPDLAIALATLSEPITPVRTLRPDCPEALEQLVMRALAREPSDRFASAREMKSALDLCQPSPQLAQKPVRDPALDEDTLRIRTFVPPRPRPRPRSKVRQCTRRAVAAVALLGGLALAQLTVGAGAPGHRAAGSLTSDASPREPLFRTGELATQLALKTTAGATQLFSHVHASARELLQAVRNPARIWGAEESAPVGEN